MDQRKARRVAAGVVAEFARTMATAHAGQTGAATMLELSTDDRDRLYRAYDGLAAELYRRAGVDRQTPARDPNQIPLFGEDEAREEAS